MGQALAVLLWPLRTSASAVPQLVDTNDTMAALARVALPTALDEDARDQAVRSFWSWVDGFRPGVDLMATEDTAFLMELPFVRRMVSASESPRERYEEQLRALDEEARELHGQAFTDLERGARKAIVRKHVAASVAELDTHGFNPVGAPALWLAGPAAFVGTSADHVTVALMAFYFNSPDGIDRSLGRAFRARTCRGFAGVEREPAELDS